MFSTPTEPRAASQAAALVDPGRGARERAIAMSCFGLDAKRRQGTGTAVTAAEVPKEGKKIEGIYDVFQRDR